MYMSFQLTKALINNYKIQTKQAGCRYFCNIVVLSAPDGPHVGSMNLAIRDTHPIRRFIIRSRKVSRFVFRIVRSLRNLTGTLGSNAAEAPVQFQSDTNIFTSDLARFYENSR